MDLATSQLEISYTCEGFDLAVAADDLSGEIEIQVTLTGPDGDRHSMSKRASRGADGVRVARFRWPQIGFPVSSINAQVGGVDGAVCGGRARAGALVAGNLFPADDAAYKAMFARKVNRTGSRFADYFIADQIRRFFCGSAHYRCGAAVVMGYKAVEISDPVIIAHAIANLQDALLEVEQCPIHWHPRHNGEHLKASLLCCLWHAQLAAMDGRGFRDTLSRIEDLSGKLTNYFTACYPLTLSLLAMATLRWLQGDHARVESIATLAVAVFKRGVADSIPDKVNLFAELKVSHLAVLQALKLGGSTTLASEELRTIFQHALRVSGKAAAMLFAHLQQVVPDISRDQ